METLKLFFDPVPLATSHLTISGIGVREPMKPCIIDRPQGTGDYLLMFFYQPTLIGAQTGIQPHPANTIIVWHPQNGHYYGNTQTRWSHSWLHCAGRLIHQVTHNAALPLNTAWPFSRIGLLEQSLWQLYDELSDYDQPDPAIVANLTENLFRQLARDYHQHQHSSQSTTPTTFRLVRRYLESHWDRPVTLEQLAKMTHYSVPHFCSEFKRHFGVSAIAYLIKLRMRRAAFLLADTNLRVIEIARQLGYQDSYYFSRHFKRHHGLSPRQWRRQQSTNNAPKTISSLYK